MSNLNNVNFKMDYNKYTKEELVALCNTYKSKIDYLESLKNNVVLDNVIKCDCKLERHERAKMELDYNKCMDCKKEIH